MWKRSIFIASMFKPWKSAQTRGYSITAESYKALTDLEMKELFTADFEKKMAKIPRGSLIWHSDAAFGDSIDTTSYSGLVRLEDDYTVERAYSGKPLKHEYTRSSLNEEISAIKRAQTMALDDGVPKVLFVTDSFHAMRLFYEIGLGIKPKYEPINHDEIKSKTMTKTLRRKLTQEQKVHLAEGVFENKGLFNYCDLAWHTNSPADRLSKKFFPIPLDLTLHYQKELLGMKPPILKGQGYRQELLLCKTALREVLNVSMEIIDPTKTPNNPRELSPEEILSFGRRFSKLTLNEVKELERIVRVEAKRGYEIPFDPFRSRR